MPVTEAHSRLEDPKTPSSPSITRERREFGSRQVHEVAHFNGASSSHTGSPEAPYNGTDTEENRQIEASKLQNTFDFTNDANDSTNNDCITDIGGFTLQDEYQSQDLDMSPQLHPHIDTPNNHKEEIYPGINIDHSSNHKNKTNPDSQQSSLSSERSSTRLSLKSSSQSPSSSTLKSSKYSLDYFDKYIPNNITNNRIPKFHNSYLRPNAQFVGEQQCGKARFHIKVEFKTVDFLNSIVTGFLQISGLTEDHAEIITCFKGEIINNPLNAYNWQSRDKKSVHDFNVKYYSFITENKYWGSYAKNDFEHWKRLTGSAHLTDDELEKRLQDIQRGEDDNQYIYMRWKEKFLLPDSRIKQISGASFEGFYYIVLNIGGMGNPTNSNPLSFSNSISPGSISGLYYHKSSEKFQSLNLRYVEDRGVSSTFQFI
ncbi:vacuolar import and degradation protein-domain-containing protein [Scheffersomyces xylosifermentans]|uniref:vacuolar import and degradation protein-domain-containing protein n=1 Tax=Scheffersomyces xylosifermentans TaxID=1304137 RepID=UPI00315CAB6C